jgi:hypothetical protein
MSSTKEMESLTWDYYYILNVRLFPEQTLKDLPYLRGAFKF